MIFLASVFFFVSIIFGLLVYGSLIQSLYDLKELDEVDVYGNSVRCFAVLQWITFAVGIAFLIVTLYQII